MACYIIVIELYQRLMNQRCICSNSSTSISSPFNPDSHQFMISFTALEIPSDLWIELIAAKRHRHRVTSWTILLQVMACHLSHLRITWQCQGWDLDQTMNSQRTLYHATVGKLLSVCYEWFGKKYHVLKRLGCICCQFPLMLFSWYLQQQNSMRDTILKFI